MNSKIIALLTFVIVSSHLNSSFAQLKKVRLAIPTVDIVTLPLKMAQAKSFYQKEGLEVEIILVIGALGVRAILGIRSNSPLRPDRSWPRRRAAFR
jgi:uncharacterized membrane protein